MGLDDFDEKIAWLSDEKKKKMPLIKNICIKNCEETISEVEKWEKKIAQKEKNFYLRNSLLNTCLHPDFRRFPNLIKILIKIRLKHLLKMM